MQKRKIMRLKIILIALTTFIFTVKAENPDYGYLLDQDEKCYVWWAEGAYKIKREDPVPDNKSSEVKIWAARNEYEPFQIVLHPRKRLEQVRIFIDNFINDQGDILDHENITIRKVEYVNVTKPTDNYGKTGWWPDPLPMYDGPFTAYPGQNYPIWVIVKVPGNAEPGIYKGNIKLTSLDWKSIIPVQLEVWNFTLPEKVSIRSAFGVSTRFIQQYHNLDSQEELQQVTDKYYHSLKEYKLCPTSPFNLYPIEINIEGIDWEGGLFDKDTVFAGNQSYKLEDDSYTETTEGECRGMIRMDQSDDYKLTWFVKTGKPDQRYSVLVKGYNAEKEYLPFENRMEVFKGSEEWKADTFSLGKFRPEVKYLAIHFFPVFRDLSGSTTGTAWFDNVSVFTTSENINLLPEGDFEVDIDKITIELNFTKFDQAAQRYLNEFRFNSFNLLLKGMPSGNYYSQRLGVFEGFIQGSPEYDLLMKQYLNQVQDHLEKNGWLGKEYVYWFDEPNRKDYPFVREGMGILNRSAPKITRFITEHQPGPDIMDVSEISCTIWHRMDPDIVAELVKEGREFWSYLCCWPKSPWISEFIDHDAVNLRMWLWMSYKYQLKGILIWSTNYWNSDAASPKGFLQNPWEDPMSYVKGYGWPYGKQTIWGNGDGRFFYPPNRNPNDHSKKFFNAPVPSLRLEILREGIEDYEYIMLLEKAIQKAGRKQKEWVTQARELLKFPEEMFVDGKTYNKDPQYILSYRKRIADLLNQFY